MRNSRFSSGAVWKRRESFLIAMVVCSLFLLYTVQAPKPSTTLSTPSHHYSGTQEHYLKYTSSSSSYKIAIISDKDTRSHNPSKNHWESIIRYGTLHRDPQSRKYAITWDEEDVIVASKLSEGGRGMELSELVHYNGYLYAPDDRTGIVYKIVDDTVIPSHILMNGDGMTNKGFKAEWATVKDGKMYVGGIGKEWINNEGVLINNHPQWVKIIDQNGSVEHVDWGGNFEALRKAVGAQHPGYLWHEAVRWNPVSKRWLFLPRRFSDEAYDEALDEKRATNLLISANEDFTDIKTTRIGTLSATRGFSTFVLVPHRENEAIAIKSEEVEGQVASYLTAFNVQTGEILMEELFIAAEKFEGIEVL